MTDCVFFDGSLVKDDWNPKRDRFDTVTYAPYLEFALFLSHKTRQTISFFCKLFGGTIYYLYLCTE